MVPVSGQAILPLKVTPKAQLRYAFDIILGWGDLGSRFGDIRSFNAELYSKVFLFFP